MAKYEVRGRFENGEEWAEDAKNLGELQFVLEKVFSNGAINRGSVRITNGKGEEITKSIIKRFYGEE